MLGVGARDVELSRRGSGGQQELVVGDGIAVRQQHLGRDPVDAGRLGAEPQFDLVLGVPGVGMDEDALAFGGALQEALGQRWPLVRRLELIRQENDLAVEALVAERLDGLGASQPASDDNVSGHSGAPMGVVRWMNPPHDTR